MLHPPRTPGGNPGSTGRRSCHSVVSCFPRTALTRATARAFDRRSSVRRALRGDGALARLRVGGAHAADRAGGSARFDCACDAHDAVRRGAGSGTGTGTEHNAG